MHVISCLWSASLPLCHVSSDVPDGRGQTKSVVSCEFKRGGSESLENPQVFQTPEVSAAGGLPAELLRETKRRMFAAQDGRERWIAVRCWKIGAVEVQ